MLKDRARNNKTVILYIPFLEGEFNFLDRVQLIEQAIKDQQGSVQLVIHGEKIQPIALRSKVVVYVFAHGLASDSPLSHCVASSTNPEAASHLSIIKLAKRLNVDLAHYLHTISVIKLFFCNQKQDEKKIALLFQKYLMGAGTKRIDYYAGILATEHFAKQHPYYYKKYVIGETQQSLSTCRQSLFPKAHALLPHPRHSKNTSILTARAIKQRRIQFFKLAKNARFDQCQGKRFDNDINALLLEKFAKLSF